MQLLLLQEFSLLQTQVLCDALLSNGIIFQALKFITCYKQILVAVTQVSEEYRSHLKPMTEHSLVFLTSKDKLPQLHFPQEEKAHLFRKDIKNKNFLKHAVRAHCRFFSLLLVEPQEHKGSSGLTPGSTLRALSHLLSKIPQDRLLQTDQKREREIWI